jgi:hypothetical protein
MRARRYKWSPEKQSELRRLWRIEGVSVPEIAWELGVSYHQVLYQADKLRLCMHPRVSRPSDNLRVPRKVWGGSDFDFWRIKSDTEVSRA